MATRKKIQPQVKERYLQDWLAALNKAAQSGNNEEAVQLHLSLKLCLLGSVKQEKFIDIRVHKQLGEVYLRAKNYTAAITQFNLYLSALPADITVLHRLGLALIENKNFRKCAGLIGQAEKLDKNIMQWHIDWAALKGRWNREQWKLSGKQKFLEAARSIYETSAKNNPGSYYIADVAGQSNLLLGDVTRAQSHYKNILSIVEGLKEQSAWSQASKLTAYIVLKREEEVEKELQVLKTFTPDSRALERIEKTVDEIGRLAGTAKDKLDRWKKVLLN